ncbi:hypothetical protein JHK82_043433 [Glycine max]|nr:hypothetical protein JHK82_043433 [Glycine max]
MQRGKRRLYEDLGLDREDDFQTDDEENQAQRVFEHLDDDTDSDNNSPTSRNLYNEVVTPLAKYALTLLPIALNIEELTTSLRLRYNKLCLIIVVGLVCAFVGTQSAISKIAGEGD